MRFASGTFTMTLPILLSASLLSAAASADMAKVGQPAPRLMLRDLDGRVFSLADIAYPGPERPGHQRQPVLLDFFGTHCPPCKAKLPKVIALHNEKASQGLMVVMVALLASEDREAEQKLRDFLARSPVPFPVVLDRFEDVGKRWIYDDNSLALGTMVLVGADGTIRAVGVSLDEDFMQAVKAVLPKPTVATATER
jgi:thiol-disulfide isomerase/thioredoxin